MLVYQPLESFPPSANLWRGCWLVQRYNCWLAPKGKPILTLAADDNHLIIIESIILVYVRSQALVSMAWDWVDWGSGTSIGAWPPRWNQWHATRLQPWLWDRESWDIKTLSCHCLQFPKFDNGMNQSHHRSEGTCGVGWGSLCGLGGANSNKSDWWCDFEVYQVRLSELPLENKTSCTKWCSC